MRQLLLRFRFFVVIPALALLMVAGFTNMSSAHAAGLVKPIQPVSTVVAHTGENYKPKSLLKSNSLKPNSPFGYYYIANIQYQGQDWHHDVDFQLGPHLGGNIAQTWTIANSYEASGGISADGVSAGLKFSVTLTHSTSYTCTVPTNTTKRFQDVVFDGVYDVYSFDVRWYDYFGSDVLVGSGWAENFSGASCYVVNE